MDGQTDRRAWWGGRLGRVAGCGRGVRWWGRCVTVWRWHVCNQTAVQSAELAHTRVALAARGLRGGGSHGEGATWAG